MQSKETLFLLYLCTGYVYESSLGVYSKPCVKRPLSKRPKIVFSRLISFNAGQKYCRMLQEDHFAILSTLFPLKIFVLSIFQWPFYTDFTVYAILFGYKRPVLLSPL